MSLVSNSFIHCMRLYRKLSLVLLSISSLIGLVRGYRMTNYPEGNSILLPYSDEIIKETVFSNYATFGWIFFTLIGVFGIIAMIAVLSKFRYFAYLIIIESIFLSFFTHTTKPESSSSSSSQKNLLSLSCSLFSKRRPAT